MLAWNVFPLRLYLADAYLLITQLWNNLLDVYFVTIRL